MIDVARVWEFLRVVEEIEDNSSSERLEINLIKSRTQVNPTAVFSYQSPHQSKAFD